jgi:hypothetical protein
MIPGFMPIGHAICLPFGWGRFALGRPSGWPKSDGASTFMGNPRAESHPEFGGSG